MQRINDNHERFASKVARKMKSDPNPDPNPNPNPNPNQVARKMKSEQEYYDARYGFDGETAEAPKN